MEVGVSMWRATYDFVKTVICNKRRLFTITLNAVGHGQIPLDRGSKAPGAVGGTVYMTTSVPCNWAGAVMQKLHENA